MATQVLMYPPVPPHIGVSLCYLHVFKTAHKCSFYPCSSSCVLLLPHFYPSSLSLYLASLLQLSEHHNRAAPPLPDHPPEVLDGVLQWALTRYVRVLLSVALHTHKYNGQKTICLKKRLLGGKKKRKRTLT